MERVTVSEVVRYVSIEPEIVAVPTVGATEIPKVNVPPLGSVATWFKSNSKGISSNGLRGTIGEKTVGAVANTVTSISASSVKSFGSITIYVME